MSHPRQSALQDFRFNQRVLEDAINRVRIPDYLGLHIDPFDSFPAVSDFDQNHRKSEI
jgi:hypothetical protein